MNLGTLTQLQVERFSAAFSKGQENKPVARTDGRFWIFLIFRVRILIDSVGVEVSTDAPTSSRYCNLFWLRPGSSRNSCLGLTASRSIIVLVEMLDCHV
jgi:hypothetical protein